MEIESQYTTIQADVVCVFYVVHVSRETFRMCETARTGDSILQCGQW